MYSLGNLPYPLLKDAKCEPLGLQKDLLQKQALDKCGQVEMKFNYSGMGLNPTWPVSFQRGKLGAEEMIQWVKYLLPE